MALTSMGMMGTVVRVIVHQWDFNRDSLARTARIPVGAASSWRPPFRG
jgi:hypothetical protein